MHCKDISDLATILRNEGDQILDATSKLSLSASLLTNLNKSFSKIISNDVFTSSFHVLNTSNHLRDNFIDLQFLYDFVQKTLALKIFPDCNLFTDECIDIQIFHNIKLLEVQRFNLHFIKGLKNLRSQLEYVICMRSVSTLKEVLENCGADKTQGYVWCQLKEAVFSHNHLEAVDASLEFAPWLISLDLSYNYIQNIEPLNCLANLNYLNLSNNKIEQIPAFSGQLCNNLKVLVLRNNFIEDLSELCHLHNLKELDLSNNCLIHFDALLPITHLTRLNKLHLQDNPFVFAPNYRLQVSRYLHINNSSFKLDGKCLSARELRFVGSVQANNPFLMRNDSFDSSKTGNTVIADKCGVGNNVTVADVHYHTHTSDMEVSVAGSEVGDDAGLMGIDLLRSTILFQEQGMQDSGFVAEVRPVSPSDSIGSARSLQVSRRPSDQTVNYTESDIEILSNPSQSSIEVLSMGQAPRCTHSCLVPSIINQINQTNSDIKKLGDEFHRSL